MKKELRAQLLAQRNGLTQAYIADASARMREMLFRMPVFAEARTVLLYVSMGSEVDTEEIIRHSLQKGKRVAIPFLHRQFGKMEASEIHDQEAELMVGKYNTRVPKQEYYRPIAAKEIDLVLVPAIAYDIHGNRMGYGGGYYDRYLKTVAAHTALIGITFSKLVVEQLPVLTYDVPVHLVLHEQGIIDISQKHTKTP